MQIPLPLARLFIGALILFASASLCSATSRRSADASNIRQIGQASLIFAQGHNDRLPPATDVWNYATLLAEGGGIESAQMWQSKFDPACGNNYNVVPLILTQDARGEKSPHPEFLKLKLSLAVPLGRLTTSMPPTTPITWTRGLQSDGTWATHSPYQGQGGYIVFLAGNIQFFKNLGSSGAGELLRYDGKGKTANILEALPPRTRIGEYVPTEAEQRSWAWRAKLNKNQPVIGGAVIALIALSIGIYACIKRALRPPTLIAAAIATIILLGVLYATIHSLPALQFSSSNP